MLLFVVVVVIVVGVMPLTPAWSGLLAIIRQKLSPLPSRKAWVSIVAGIDGSDAYATKQKKILNCNIIHHPFGTEIVRIVQTLKEQVIIAI